jgi:hypothetical protein
MRGSGHTIQGNFFRTAAGVEPSAHHSFGSKICAERLAARCNVHESAKLAPKGVSKNV